MSESTHGEVLIEKALIPTYTISPGWPANWQQHQRERHESIAKMWDRWWLYEHYRQICRNGERL